MRDAYVTADRKNAAFSSDTNIHDCLERDAQLRRGKPDLQRCTSDRVEQKVLAARAPQAWRGGARR